jgi:hypothetical protein
MQFAQHREIQPDIAAEAMPPKPEQPNRGIGMVAKKALVMAAATAAIGLLGVSVATAASDHDQSLPRLFVMPCSLDGINPAYHPDIFGDPAAARSYGFVRSRDGTWHVQSGCRRY